MHTVEGTAANVNDVTEAGALLHGEEDVAFGDAGYQACTSDLKPQGPTWYVAMRPERGASSTTSSSRSSLPSRPRSSRPACEPRSSIRSASLKRQFGFTKVRYRGLAKNTAQLVTLFALSNLWMARRRLMGARG